MIVFKQDIIFAISGTWDFLDRWTSQLSNLWVNFNEETDGFGGETSICLGCFCPFMAKIDPFEAGPCHFAALATMSSQIIALIALFLAMGKK